MAQVINPDQLGNPTVTPPDGAASFLDAGPAGCVVYAGDADWHRARAAWIANLDQQPAAVSVVKSIDDVSAAAVRHRAGVMGCC